MEKYIDLYFASATILNWYPILRDEKYKNVIIDAFRFAVEQKRATIWAYVIMDIHIHLVWQILDPYQLGKVRRDLLKYTGQIIKNDMVRNHKDELLSYFIVRKKDRHIQIWKEKPMSIVILNECVLQ